MRIAFVGKGGAGKTTVTSLFSLYLKHNNIPMYVFDADINMHITENLSGTIFPEDLYLSNTKNSSNIKEFLKGNNDRIKSMSEFKKTTPPNEKSEFIKLNESNNVINNYSIDCNGIPVFAVGPHTVDKIGANCYHAKLEVLETILNHTIDNDDIIVSDMVAGTDCFSSTLHMQFDLLVLVVEPTKQSISVYNQFLELAQAAGVINNLKVIANKILDNSDEYFIQKNIKSEHLLGFIKNSRKIKIAEQNYDILTQDLIDDSISNLFDKTYQTLKKQKIDIDKRYNNLLLMHKKYSKNDFIKERFGDLSRQIDPSFKPSNLNKGI